MKEKVKCKKCGLLIDDDMQYCPYCGYIQDQNENQNEDKNHVPLKRMEAEPCCRHLSPFIYVIVIVFCPIFFLFC